MTCLVCCTIYWNAADLNLFTRGIQTQKAKGVFKNLVFRARRDLVTHLSTIPGVSDFMRTCWMGHFINKTCPCRPPEKATLAQQGVAKFAALLRYVGQVRLCNRPEINRFLFRSLALSPKVTSCAMIRVTRFRRRRHWVPTATQWWVGPPDPNLRHPKKKLKRRPFFKKSDNFDKPSKTGRCLRKRDSGTRLWLLGHDCQERGYLMLKTPIFESPTWPTLLRPWKFWTCLHWQRRLSNPNTEWNEAPICQKPKEFTGLAKESSHLVSRPFGEAKNLTLTVQLHWDALSAVRCSNAFGRGFTSAPEPGIWENARLTQVVQSHASPPPVCTFFVMTSVARS